MRKTGCLVKGCTGHYGGRKGRLIVLQEDADDPASPKEKFFACDECKLLYAEDGANLHIHELGDGYLGDDGEVHYSTKVIEFVDS
ncbi:MAG: hypothetical protein WCX71_05415 [Candidatus Buchananbacteria bacterium]